MRRRYRGVGGGDRMADGGTRIVIGQQLIVGMSEDPKMDVWKSLKD